MKTAGKVIKGNFTAAFPFSDNNGVSVLQKGKWKRTSLQRHRVREDSSHRAAQAADAVKSVLYRLIAFILLHICRCVFVIILVWFWYIKDFDEIALSIIRIV